MSTDLEREQACSSFAHIVFEVGNHFNVTVTQIMGTARMRRVALARKVAMYVARVVTKASYPELGRYFKRDHSTVITAYQWVLAARLEDPRLRTTVDAIVAEFEPERNLNITQQVKEYSYAFGLPVFERPVHSSAIAKNVVHTRLVNIIEAFNTVLESHGVKIDNPIPRAAVELVSKHPEGFKLKLGRIAEDLAELDYFVESMRLAYGIARQPAANACHTSKMASMETRVSIPKERGDDGEGNSEGVDFGKAVGA